MPRPTQDQLVKINRMALKEMTEDNCFVFPNMMIDDQVTSYSSRLHHNLLRKFVKDAGRGVGLLMSHDNGRLPVGRSFDARLMEEYDHNTGEVVESVYGDFYIDLGRNTESQMTTDDIANGIESGTIFDTSIGFNASKWDCSICGNDIRDYHACPHIPGRKYIVQNEELEDDVATCVVEVGSDGVGELLENSLVYAGACGRATITNSNFSAGSVREMEKGTKLHLIENLKQVPLDATIFQYFSKDGCIMYSDKPESVDAVQNLVNVGSDDNVDIAKFNEVLGQFGISATTPDELGTALGQFKTAQDELATKTEEVTKLTTELTDKTAENETLSAQLSIKDETISELTVKNEELSLQAEVAKTYRQDLVGNALELGVRAQGNAFNKTLYAKFLETLSIDEVKEVISGFEGEVQAKFSGAKTTGTQEPLRNRMGAEPTSIADFEDEGAFRTYVADEAIKLAETSGVSIKDATATVYKKFSKDGSEE